MKSTTAQRCALEGARKRMVMGLHSAMLLLAVCGVFFIGRVLIDANASLIATALHLRTAVGLMPPASGPDLYLVAATLIGPAGCVLALTAALRWYRRVWRERLDRVWTDDQQHRIYRKIGKLAGRSRTAQEDYLSALAASPVWLGRGKLPSTTDDEEASARHLSEAIFVELEKDVSARALAVGLAVGAGKNPFIDSCAILASNFEMQLFVLGELGKRPSSRTWWMIATRCTASLFVNSYLNSADAMAINLVIRKAALGLEVGGETLQAGADHLSSVLEQGEAAVQHVDAADFDADELHGHLGGLAGLIGETAMFGMTVGSVAMNQIARFIEKYGNDAVQGCIAGSILYWHGMELAADILAENEEHRHCPAFRRSVRDAATSIAISAGEILRGAVQELRATYRSRRVAAVKSLGDAAKSGGGKVANTVQNFFRNVTGK